MTQLPAQPPIQVKPQPDIYTVLILVAILGLVLTIGVSLYYLLASPPIGCGLSLSDLFGKVAPLSTGR
ncbi:MAG: hypothetical protein ABSH10_01485 [Phycisphaerae bacterium]|jgi:hypothetical protein